MWKEIVKKVKIMVCDDCGKEDVIYLYPCPICGIQVCDDCVIKHYPGWVLCKRCAERSPACKKYLKAEKVFRAEFGAEYEKAKEKHKKEGGADE